MQSPSSQLGRKLRNCPHEHRQQQKKKGGEHIGAKVQTQKFHLPFFHRQDNLWKKNLSARVIGGAVKGKPHPIPALTQPSWAVT